MRQVLFNPGPVMCDPRVHAAGNLVDSCHREQEMVDVLAEVRGRVSDLCGGSEVDSVILTGSGSAALEAVLSSLPAEGLLLVADNGYYGTRLADTADALGLHVERLNLPWGSRIDAKLVESELFRLRPTHFAVVHHETSTGMMNDVMELGRTAREAGAAVIVDAISSIGCETLSVTTGSIDWLVGSSNKCIEGLPGLSFVSGRKELWARLSEAKSRGRYLDLATNAKSQIHGGVPAFTPAVNTLLAFRVALELLAVETVDGRKARYGKLTRDLRVGLEELGFSIDLAPDERATMLTSILLPSGVSFEQLHQELKTRGYVIYASQGELRNSRFRLATMGTMTDEDVQTFLHDLADVVHEIDAGNLR